MSIVFLAKGVCNLGITNVDQEGNVRETTPAQFVADDNGGSIVVGILDPETMKPIEPISGIFGDYDAAGYLSEALKLLKPRRRINIPDLKAIIQKAYREDGNDLLCDYCQSWYCQDCIVREWRDE